jgi:RNA polymerase sigma-70 factor (ECF subfamily)
MNDHKMTGQLLERVRRKDRKAQHEFYQLYSTPMFRLTYRYVNNEVDAGSIVNMGFYNIFNHIGEFIYQGEKSLQAWMKKIIINEALMFLRQQYTHPSLEDCSPGNLQDEIFPCEDLMLEDYYQLIRQLPVDLRTVFNLFAIDGFSHKEIAWQLNIKESSSRVYLARARNILQEKIMKKQMQNGK